MSELKSNKFITLQDLCLDVIADNFKRFIVAFNTSDDARLQLNLEFLRRRFTTDLAFKKFLDVKNLELYVNFLINEHLDEIQAFWFRDSRYWKSMERILCRVPNLQTLSMSQGDEVLKNVAKFCPKITRIDAITSSVTDEGIEYLCKLKDGVLPCPELKCVNMCNSFITDRGAKRLIESLPALEYFSYPNLPFVLHSIYKENQSNPPSFNLAYLNLVNWENGSFPSRVIRSCLITCPELEEVECYVFKKKQINALSNSRLYALELLISIRNPNLLIDGYLKSGGVCNLIELKITHGTLSVSALAYCSALEDLYLNDVNLIDEEYDLRPHFPSLTEIMLSMEDSMVARACHLFSASSFSKMVSVTFSACSLTDQVKDAILAWCRSSTIKNLIFLNVTQIRVGFFRNILFKCHSLEELRLYDCKRLHKWLCKVLIGLAKSLPNKPKIVLLKYI